MFELFLLIFTPAGSSDDKHPKQKKVCSGGKNGPDASVAEICHLVSLFWIILNVSDCVWVLIYMLYICSMDNIYLSVCSPTTEALTTRNISVNCVGARKNIFKIHNNCRWINQTQSSFSRTETKHLRCSTTFSFYKFKLLSKTVKISGQVHLFRFNLLSVLKWQTIIEDKYQLNK